MNSLVEAGGDALNDLDLDEFDLDDEDLDSLIEEVEELVDDEDL